MKYIRIIPRLDIKGPNLVKGINFEGLRVMGRPQEFASGYYTQGADEFIYMDIVASLYGRNSLHSIVEKTSKEIYIPMTVGGGLRSLADIQSVLRAGADKVSLNTAAIKTPELIKEVSKQFGSSTIVVSIEAKKKSNGQYEAYTDNGREKTGWDAFDWAQKAVELGAGELLVTSIDCEGTGNGFDVDLTRKIAESVNVPIIASGGAGSLEDILNVIVNGKADAVAIASVLHYKFLEDKKAFMESSRSSDSVKSFTKSAKIDRLTLSQIKSYLIKAGIPCRFDQNKEEINNEN